MSTEDKYRIILADDYEPLRQVFRRMIEQFPGLEIVGEAEDGRELLNLIQMRSPHLILLDAAMPHLQGLRAAMQIKKIFPSVKVLILSMHIAKEYLYRALAHGADGYMLKEETDAELFSAIQQIRLGGTYISAALKEVRFIFP
jgi:two-component system, NarL family, response regulator NreC